MPFFKDLGGDASKLLGGPGGHEAYIDNKKVSVSNTTANGTKFEFEKNINDGGKTDASGTISFKHSSGINFKKFKVDTKGKANFEAELAEAMPNTKMYVKIGTLKDGKNSFKKFQAGDDIPAGKNVGDFNTKAAQEESGALGFKFDNKDVAVDTSIDILAMDAPVVKFSIAAGVPGIDGLTVGADALYKTSLDGWGGSTEGFGGNSGKTGMQMLGPTKPDQILKAVAANYSGGDFDLTAKYAPSKKNLDVSYHQKVNADVSVAATCGMALGGAFEPALEVGGSYSVDKDTSIYGKVNSKDQSVSLAFTQAINSAVTLTCATSILAQDMTAQKFGMGVEFSN